MNLKRSLMCDMARKTSTIKWAGNGVAISLCTVIAIGEA